MLNLKHNNFYICKIVNTENIWTIHFGLRIMSMQLTCFLASVQDLSVVWAVSINVATCYSFHIHTPHTGTDLTYVFPRPRARPLCCLYIWVVSINGGTCRFPLQTHPTLCTGLNLHVYNTYSETSLLPVHLSVSIAGDTCRFPLQTHSTLCTSLNLRVSHTYSEISLLPVHLSGLNCPSHMWQFPLLPTHHCVWV